MSKKKRQSGFNNKNGGEAKPPPVNSSNKNNKHKSNVETLEIFCNTHLDRDPYLLAIEYLKYYR